MGEFEALGDAVTGGLLGRAVEPEAGEAAPTATRTRSNCLNCGTPLIGHYCHACGQNAHVHRSLRAFFQDFLHGAVQLRRQDLADAADARVEAGRADPPLHRGRARALHLADRALFLFSRLPDVRGAQLHRRARPIGSTEPVSGRASNDEHRGRPEQARAARSASAGRRRPREDVADLDTRDRQAARATLPTLRRCSDGRRASPSRTTPATRRRRWITMPFIENAQGRTRNSCR